MTIFTPQDTQAEVIALDSRTVAEWTNRQHSELMKDIRRYSDYLKQGKIPATDFWQKTTYTASNGKENPCYMITKKGCEFIQHKMTGQKGAVFTAKYINYFHDIEAGLHEAAQILLELEEQPTPQHPLPDISDLTYIKNKISEVQDMNNLADITAGLARVTKLVEVIGG
ncbi:Rha family transcriptional regulator [Streptococcus merionis]|uniref:Rha family transcriptional regulator n=1 Tax=Streptococcus merionis TaxID=400065 RepID=UPI0035142FAF